MYRVFKEVAEAGNITAAAQALFISQSAVSQSIKQLESRPADPPVLPETPAGVTLTAEGKMLYEYVRSAMGLLETGEEKLSQTRELQMGQLIIGASDTVTSQFLLPYLDRLPPAVPRRAHPDRLRPQPQGAGPAAIRQGGHRLCQHATGCMLPWSTFRCFATHSIFVAAADYDCDFDHIYSLEEIVRIPADPAGAQGLQPPVSG